MKNILLILIITFFTANLLAQDCKYVKYYPLVELASKNYSDKKYKDAERNLKLAFTKTNFPLGKDLHLALLIAQKRKDTKWAEQIAIRLAKGGVPLRYFRYYNKFKWYDKLKADFKTYSDYYHANFQPELREEFLSLHQRDKEFNSRYHEWRTREIEMTLQELIDGAHTILTDFKNLTDKYGFPNERIMGYNYIQRKNNIEHYSAIAIIIHIWQRGVLIFKDEIHQIVCDGGIHPRFEETLKKIRGFGNSAGIEQEMNLRYKMYKPNE